MQKHNLNAEYARLAPQFLAFLDREEKKLRDEMERLKRKTTRDEKGGRFRFRRLQGQGDSAENRGAVQRVPFSAENQLPVGGTLILSPDHPQLQANDAVEVPAYIRALQGLTTDTVITAHDDDVSILGAEPKPQKKSPAATTAPQQANESPSRAKTHDNPLITTQS